MHIIIAILGAPPRKRLKLKFARFRARAAAFWAFTHFMNAANQGREAIGEVKGVIRRGKWNRRVDQRLIENLSDPREAAAVLLYQMAAYDGAVTDRQQDHIIEAMRNAFEADDETAQGLYAFGRMAVGEINDAGNNVRKILRPVVEVCTQGEKIQLVELLERVAEIEGPPTDIQRRLIAEARRVLLSS